MQARGLGAALALVLGVAGSATANDGQTREVQSQDGSFTGEIVGTPAQGSKFAQLQIGMSMQDVQELMDSAPGPFPQLRVGQALDPVLLRQRCDAPAGAVPRRGLSDLHRRQHLGGGGSQLIQIEVDPAGDCYQP